MSDSLDQSTTPLPRRSRGGRGRLVRRILLSLALLISGSVIGSGITVIMVARGVHYRIHHPEVFPARAAARLQRTLELSDEQSQQVEQILREQQKDILAIRRECQPRFEREVDEIREEISGVLTPAQDRKWRAWLADRRRTWLPALPATAPAE